MNRPEPAFLEPWHAHVFALTVHLHDLGIFSWRDWTEHFGATLNRHRLLRSLEGGDDYFNAWLETLEGVLLQAGMTREGDVEALRSSWEEAYLRTPHGSPVALEGPNSTLLKNQGF